MDSSSIGSPDTFFMAIIFIGLRSAEEPYYSKKYNSTKNILYPISFFDIEGIALHKKIAQTIKKMIYFSHSVI